MDMNTRKYGIISLLALVALGGIGCYEDDRLSGTDTMQGQTVEMIINGDIAQRSTTRVNDGGFVNGDAMGVYIVDYTDSSTPGELLAQGNHVTNMKFVYDEAAAAWKGTSAIYWTDNKTAIDAYGYYPFCELVENPTAMPLGVLERQDKNDEKTGFSNYEASDVLWANALNVSPGNVIPLKYRHIMAGIEISLVAGIGFEATEWTDLEKMVTVDKVVSEGTLNLKTGKITNNTEKVLTVVPAANSSGYRAVILPQTKSAGATLFNITVGGDSYAFTRTEDMVFEGGKLHKFTIQVTERLPEGDYEFTLLSEAITDWVDDGISHDGEAREYVLVESPVAGGLEEVLSVSGLDLNQLYNLKITGEMDPRDFLFLRKNVTSLEAVNLKEVLLKDGTFEVNLHAGSAFDWLPEEPLEDDVLPDNAFLNLRTLKYIVFPDNMKKIGASALRGTGLVGALSFPEGVTHIGSDAFNDYESNIWGLITETNYMFLTSLSLPLSLEYIGEAAFKKNKFCNELILPEKLKVIGKEAFSDCSHMTGELHLPSGLQTIGADAFSGLNKIIGKLIVPASLKEVQGLKGTGCTSLHLSDGLEVIGDCAFGGIDYNSQWGTFESVIQGELNVPSTVRSIGYAAFAGLQVSHAYLPEGLTEIRRDLFRGCDKLVDTLRIPSTVTQIRSGAFSNCSSLSVIVLPEGLQSIGGDNSEHSWWQFSTFEGCNALTTLQCDAKVPPTIIGDIVFDGLGKDNITLVVPEESVELYRAAEGWKEFKRISAYSNFVCRPQFANLLNKGSVREVVLNADGEWEVISKPDWCEVSATNGNKKTALTITVSNLAEGAGNREGEIVFKLKDKEVTTRYYLTQYDSEYKEDAPTTLQTASKGTGIDVVLLGDGYDAKDIAEGTYLADMKQAMEYFFGVEPYTSYREYFNVYTAFALSHDSGIGTLNTLRNPKFNTVIDANRIHCDNDFALQYVVDNVAGVDEGLANTIVILTANTSQYEGVTYMYDNGAALAICTKSSADYPFDARGVLQHEAGGHAFAKLADEYMYHRAWIQTCTCLCCEHVAGLQDMHAKGWGQNLTLTGKYKEVPWYHLIHDARYNDIVDIYDGGYFHSNGVFRSEYNSVMNNNVPYFSSWCRELIVRRIKELAGEAFDYENFVASDSREWGKDFTAFSRGEYVPAVSATAHHGTPPVIINGNPNLQKRR